MFRLDYVREGSLYVVIGYSVCVYRRWTYKFDVIRFD